MSYNLWIYGRSNPILYVDPSGKYWCLTRNQRFNTAKKIVPKTTEQDYMNTYTAAGIAIQCQGIGIADWFADEYDGKGYAQISQKQAETPYGEPVYKTDSEGKKIEFDNDGNPVVRGYGLCIGDYDFRPYDEDWAAEYMRRRIQMVVDKCKDSFCKERDKFIVAALAQNGPGFTIENVEAIKNNFLSDDNQIKWKDWYAERSDKSKNEYRTQWRLFYEFAKRLYDDGYGLPEGVLSDEIVLWLKSQ